MVAKPPPIEMIAARPIEVGTREQPPLRRDPKRGNNGSETSSANEASHGRAIGAQVDLAPRRGIACASRSLTKILGA